MSNTIHYNNCPACSGTDIEFVLKAKDETVLAALEKNKPFIEKFCNPDELQIATDIVSPDKAMTAVVTGVELFIPLADLINMEEEIARLNKELDKWTKEVERVQKKLANEKFISKAPEAVVAEERAKEKDYLEKKATVEARIKELQS